LHCPSAFGILWNLVLTQRPLFSKIVPEGVESLSSPGDTPQSPQNVEHWIDAAQQGSPDALGQVLEYCRRYRLAVANERLESEPARTFTMQMAQHRAAQIGGIAAYNSRLGNELWPKGWTLFARTVFTVAEKGFRKNLAVNPGKASAHGDFALFLLTCPEPHFRDTAKALTHAQKAVALDPANADFAALLGMAQYRAAEWQAAVETLEKAIERGPARYSGHAKIFLFMAHKQLGHITEAHRLYQEARGEMKEDSSKEEIRSLRNEAAVLLGVSEDGLTKRLSILH
jgi:tetratricopeptide (TPR) repeat protein